MYFAALDNVFTYIVFSIMYFRSEGRERVIQEAFIINILFVTAYLKCRSLGQ